MCFRNVFNDRLYKKKFYHHVLRERIAFECVNNIERDFLWLMICIHMTLAKRNRNDSNAIPCVYASYRIKYLGKAGEKNISNTSFTLLYRKELIQMPVNWTHFSVNNLW